MPQSLLAFLAMLIASIMAMNQYGAQLETYDQMIRSEYQLMANAAVVEQLEIISASMEFEDLGTIDSTQITANFEAGTLSIPFDLSFSVQYTDEDGVPQGGTTDFREVRVVASHDSYTQALVTHARLFADD